MAPRAEDLLDTSCYSELHSAYNSYISPYPLPPHLSTYVIPMASNNPQRSQAQVQPGVRFSQPLSQRQHYVAPRHTAPSEQTSLPHYFPPDQPVPVLSSMSSDNEEYAPASDPRYMRGPSHDTHDAQSYYGVRGVNLPAPLFQCQPHLGYTIPYQSQPEFTGFPFVPMQASFPLRQSELPSQTPYSTVPLQPYFTATAPTIRHARATVERPFTHRRGKNRASHVEPPPVAVVDDRIGDDRIGHELHSTPVLQRMSSGRFHDDDRRMYAKDLAPQLKQELASNISQSANLADIVFPTDCLPFPVDESLLEHLARHNIWDIEGAHFLQKPKSFSENDLAEWLNILGRTIGLAYNKRRLRIWNASTCNLPPSGSKTIRKPDLVLLDREEHSKSNFSRVRWCSIRAFAEVSSQESFPQRMPDSINEKSYLLFLTQDNRQFVPALKFDGSGNFALTITDRQGQIQMGAISIFASGKACALMVLRILAALMYGSLSDVGLDPSMICDDEGTVKTIFVNKKEFTVFRRIYALQALIGRGTKVWIVMRENNYYILKDSWIQSGRVESEIDFLQCMALHPGLVHRIPRLIEGEDLEIGNHADSTEWCRIDIGQVNRHRIHRRHVTEPIGSPLIKFPSKADFFSVIIDVVEGMFFV
jgi:hypothetical protein